MTKEYLLSKTLYGVDIIQHLIRKEFPDFVMRISGTDCGQCPDPVWADGSIIEVTMDRIPVEGQRLPDYKARFHYPDGQLLDGDAIALAWTVITVWECELGKNTDATIARIEADLRAAKEKYDRWTALRRESREYAREQARKHREILAQVEAELNLPKSLRRYATKAQEEE